MRIKAKIWTKMAGSPKSKAHLIEFIILISCLGNLEDLLNESSVSAAKIFTIPGNKH